MEKDLACNFIAYGFIDYNRCDLLPWVGLRAAWIQNRDDWKVRYAKAPVANSTYKTQGVAVPRKVVWSAIYHALCMTN